ncbi:cupin domain-containing protein [Dyadobacter jejuensis]|nr:cupin domain-containing protein [Dyadobacter jejuensis]
MKHRHEDTDLIFLQPGDGRKYDCGELTAVFKADENETSNRYSISEWWLEPNFGGVGAHQHEHNDEVFYGLEGTVSILVGDNWVEVEKGAFLRIPAQTMHDFQNRTNQKAGLLNFFIPGGFERDMPSIVKWFTDNPQT